MQGRLYNCCVKINKGQLYRVIAGSRMPSEPCIWPWQIAYRWMEQFWSYLQLMDPCRRLGNISFLHVRWFTPLFAWSSGWSPWLNPQNPKSLTFHCTINPVLKNCAKQLTRKSLQKWCECASAQERMGVLGLIAHCICKGWKCFHPCPRSLLSLPQRQHSHHIPANFSLYYKYHTTESQSSELQRGNDVEKWSSPACMTELGPFSGYLRQHSQVACAAGWCAQHSVFLEQDRCSRRWRIDRTSGNGAQRTAQLLQVSFVANSLIWRRIY